MKFFTTRRPGGWLEERLLKDRFMDSWNRNQTAECADVCCRTAAQCKDEARKAEPVPHTSRKILRCGKLLGRKIFCERYSSNELNALSSTAFITAAETVQKLKFVSRLEMFWRFRDGVFLPDDSSAPDFEVEFSL